MQSAFNVAPLHTSLPDITAVEPVAGVVLGIIVFGTASRIAGSILLEVSGPTVFLIGVILVSRCPALSRQHRSRHLRV